MNKKSKTQACEQYRSPDRKLSTVIFRGENAMEQNLIVDFVQENMKTIYTYALSRVSNREDAEDLAGDILLALLSCASRLRNEDALYGFIWSVAGNTYKKFLGRKNRHDTNPLSQDDLEHLADPADFTLELELEEDRRELLVKLRRELSLLSREYRECTLCYYFQGLSCQETAKKMGLSLDMTKYYLFKTRKLLREGIGMEREYGTKSYQPAKFTFRTLFAGSYNREYVNLFNRLLPGNILHSAYYSPVTVRELALETGIPTAYLEDEVALLVKYGLLNLLAPGEKSGKEVPGGKEHTPSGRDRYQTNMILYTEEYMDELYEKLTALCTEPLTAVLTAMRGELDALKAIGFRGADLADDRLLWPLLWLVLHRGNQRNNEQYSYRMLYDHAAGINVGIINPDETESPFTTYGFAGYSRIDENYAAAFADFGILPAKNRYLQQNIQTVKEAVYAGSGEYILFQGTQLSEIERLLQPQILAMANLYERMIFMAQDLLRSHAPESVAGLIPNVVGKTLFFDTVGLLGKCALDSGVLKLPDTEYPLAVFLYSTNADSWELKDNQN